MGISGLLPFLEKSSRPVNISQFRGCTVAVDSYCWLHKGAFGCSEKLARGEETNSYVLYCLRYIRLLQNAGVTPIMVFDGQHLPAKRETEAKRREQRQIARKRAAELLRLDRANEARNYLRQCIDVTHGMALALITECRKMGVDCIVAPYEADAQLAFLNLNKIADVVITEDSDLVLFGCSKILFKLDIVGNGILVDTEKLYLSMQLSPDAYNFDKFRYMCILSGCDYIPSLPGIGLKKALKFLKLTANPDILQVLPKLPAYLNMRQIVVTDEYKEEFMIALATFKHQIVYNPIERKLQHLTDPGASGTKLEHCRNAGNFFEEETAFELALGNLDPFTLKKVDSWNPDRITLKCSSIWSRDYNRKIANKPPVAQPVAFKMRSTRNINVTVEVRNSSAVEDEANDFEDELEIYKATKVEKVEEIDHEAKGQEEKIVQSTLSQRVSFNPFIKEKKVGGTTIDSNRIVRSRYFNKTNSASELISDSEKDTSQSEASVSEENTQAEQENSTAVTNLTDSSLQNTSNAFKQRFSSEKSEKRSLSLSIKRNSNSDADDTSFVSSTCTNTTEVTTKLLIDSEVRNGSVKKVSISERFSLEKRGRNTFSMIHDTNTRLGAAGMSTEECLEFDLAETSRKEENSGSNIISFERLSLDKRKRSISTDNDDEEGDSNTENLTPACSAENKPIKRPNIGPCRSFGLQKRNVKKAVTKNQPTLLSMFAAIRK